MAANPVLVDSSYYIHQLRLGRNPFRTLAVVSAQRDLATCGMVRCEVGRGIRNRADLAMFQRAWDQMLYIPTDNRLWLEVEAMLWQLDRSGSLLPLPDVHIACCALRVNAVVLAQDQHFQHIPGLKAVSEII